MYPILTISPINPKKNRQSNRVNLKINNDNVFII